MWKELRRTPPKRWMPGLAEHSAFCFPQWEGAMNAIADAMNSTLQPLIVKVTAVINAFTQWIEANQGLVTAFAVTVAGAAGLAVVLIAIGVAAKGAAAGITVVQTAIKGFTFLQGVAIAQGTALKTSFTLLTQSFADYRNTAIPGDGRYGKILCGFGACLDICEPGTGKHHSDEQCRSRRGSEIGTSSQMASHDKCAEKLQFSRRRGNRCDQSTGGGRKRRQR